MKKFHFLLLYCLLITPACVEDEFMPCEQDCIIFEGEVLELNTDEPINNVRVTLSCIDMDLCSSFFGSCSLIDAQPNELTFRTKEDGKFSFHFSGEQHRAGDGRWTLWAEHRRFEISSRESDGIRVYNLDSTQFDKVHRATIRME